MCEESPTDGKNALTGKTAPVFCCRPAEEAIDSREIFGEKRSVWISHGEQLYRLQITQQGKLILTK